MRQILVQKLLEINVSLRPTYIILFSLLLIFSTSLIVVRNQCLSQGYEISELASVLEKKNIIYEEMQQTYFDVMRREILINKAYNLGFSLPTNNRVYYVQ